MNEDIEVQKPNPIAERLAKLDEDLVSDFIGKAARVHTKICEDFQVLHGDTEILLPFKKDDGTVDMLRTRILHNAIQGLERSVDTTEYRETPSKFALGIMGDLRKIASL